MIRAAIRSSLRSSLNTGGAEGEAGEADPRFTARPVISSDGSPAIGEYLTLTSVGTAEGTQPIDIQGEWYLGPDPTGVTVTMIEMKDPGTYRWRSVATNAVGTAVSFSNNIFMSLAVDPEGYGVPAVFLTVEDPAAINALTKTPATIAITNRFGSTLTDAQRLVGQEKIDLKWAGNSTGQANKKAYNMTTLTAAGANNDVPLLGMPAGRDWRLLANAYDLTDLKNWFCLGLGDEVDLPWVPHGRHVEVFLNNVYQGTYFLAERVKRHVNRVNIGNAASGAFMCEIVADIQIDAGSLLFKTPLMDAPGPSAGFANDLLASFSVESGTLSIADAAINAFEAALVALDWTTVWAQMDMASAVDWFLFYDTNANIDGVRFGSVRIARDAPAGLKAGKFFFVPWDFDFAGGCPFNSPNLSPWGTATANRFILNRWFAILIEDLAFVAAIVARKPTYTPFFDAWISRLMAKSAFLDSTGARARNFALHKGQILDGGTWIYASPAEGTVAARDLWVARKAIVDADDYIPGSGAEDAYSTEVFADSPSFYCRMDDGWPPNGLVPVIGPTMNSGGQNCAVTPGAIGGNNAVEYAAVSHHAAFFSPAAVYPMTIECWVNPSILRDQVAIFVGKSSSAIWDAHYLMSNVGGGVAAITAANSVFGASGGGTAPAGTWSHLVGVYESASMRRCYLNGVEVGTETTELTPATFDCIYIASIPLATAAHHDVDPLAAGAVDFYGGIDEVAVYPTALTPERVAAHYAARGSAPVPFVADYGLDFNTAVQGDKGWRYGWFTTHATFSGTTMTAPADPSSFTTTGMIPYNGGWGHETKAYNLPQLYSNQMDPGFPTQGWDVVTQYTCPLSGPAIITLNFFQYSHGPGLIAIWHNGINLTGYFPTTTTARILGFGINVEAGDTICLELNAMGGFDGDGIRVNEFSIVYPEGSGVIVPEGYAGEVLADSPEAYYRFNETGGDVLVDHSGNGHNGIYRNDHVVFDENGAPLPLPTDVAGFVHGVPGPGTDTCVEITSPNSWMSSDSLVLPAASSYTVEAWINMSALTTTPYLTVGAIMPAFAYVNFVINASGVHNITDMSMMGANTLVWVGDGVTTGLWKHVVVVVDVVALTHKLYVNGVLILDEPYTVRNDVRNGIYVGAPFESGYASVTGSYADFAVYLHPLTAERIAAHYTSRLDTVAPSDPFADLILSRSPHAWYRNNETGGEVCTDHSGNGNHGIYESVPAADPGDDVQTPVPDPLVDVAGITYGLPGPGGDTTVEFTSNTAGMRAVGVTIPIGSPFTIEAWMLAPDISKMPQTIATIGSLGQPYTNLYSPLTDANDYFYDGPSNLTDRLTTTGGLAQPNVWRHVVGVVNGDVMNLYIDGVLVDTLTGHVRASLVSSTLTLGYSIPTKLNPHSLFRVGDVMVYLSELTAAQVVENRNARLGIAALIGPGDSEEYDPS